MQPGKIVSTHIVNGNKIVLRYPRLSDVGDFLHHINSMVEERTFLSTSKKKTRKEEVRWLRGVLKSIRENKDVVVALEMNGKIMGSVMVRSEGECKEHVGNLGISLDKEARGMGLGKLLMKTGIDESAKKMKLKIIRLSLFAPNRVAYNLYRKMGFVEVGRVRKGMSHYGKYVDEIEMAKYL